MWTTQVASFPAQSQPARPLMLSQQVLETLGSSWLAPIGLLTGFCSRFIGVPMPASRGGCQCRCGKRTVQGVDRRFAAVLLLLPGACLGILHADADNHCSVYWSCIRSRPSRTFLEGVVQALSTPSIGMHALCNKRPAPPKVQRFSLWDAILAASPGACNCLSFDPLFGRPSRR